MLRAAGLPYKPDMNDGVMITAAPLWRMIRHPKWRKDLEQSWKKLEKGEYDWSQIAYSIWPERVKKKCRQDKSIAIAHGLEEIYQEPSPQPKKHNG